ncbi:MAG: division/cell wall cluster transcriptional repressor MraZ [Lachnospiraceae bacterium]
MFIGEFNHTIDAKGRVTIPSKYREELSGLLVVQQNVDGNLAVYTEEAWNAYVEKIKQLPNAKQNTRWLKRFLYSRADAAELDKQGRVNLSARAIEYAGLEKDVVIVGNGDTLEIWSAEAWNAASEKFDPEVLLQEMEELGDLF